ncbi:MAG: DUF3857 domain-containing protein [Muribaculaceae bacterium]
MGIYSQICRHIVSILFLSFYCLGYCQTSTFEPNKKMGKPTNEEFKMTTYAPDSTAAAVFLCKKGVARYIYKDNIGFKIEYNYENRIKVLNSDGVSYADVEIPYHDGGAYNNEKIINISAAAYNMENGKVVKTKMNRDLIFKQQITKNTVLLKFSIPAVKVGTIIEYKYTISSERISELRNWYAQSRIPVIYSEYDISIPEYFIFNLETRGYEQLECVKENESVSFLLSASPYGCRASRLKFYGNNMCALKADKYIWCDDDYISHVFFELSGFSIPGEVYKSYSTTWDNIDKGLLDDSDFGGLLKMDNPFQKEMPSLHLDTIPVIEDKVAKMYSFLKSKIKWNERYSLYASDIKKDIKNGAANNASINMVLMSMMRDVGISCVPIVMSCRNTGILPVTHPSYMSLNTFIVGFTGADSTMNYIDASAINGYINILPQVLMVTKARIVAKDFNGEKWVDLSNIGINSNRTIINATINADGVITGKYSSSYKGQYASLIRKLYKNAKDSAAFVNDLESKGNIKILSLEHDGITEFSPEVRINIDFKKNIEVNGDLMYLNPMIFLDKSTNPFTQVERKLPIEMAFQENVITAVNITIPDGYSIEEQPKAQIIKLDENGGYCSFLSNNTSTGISLQYKFKLNTILFLAPKYAQLRNFWSMVVEKNNEMLVLKKKTAVQ